MSKSIPKLKDDARKHEQKEEWEKAINAYAQVLKIGEAGDGADLDLPLYNRVGDLHVRLGRPADAVQYYEQAADRYAEAGLYNNAIALCNKALRYDASRLELLKKLGSFSASQGFFTDARRWYLEYAEKSMKRGALDEAFSALSDYADVNDEADIREMLARQLREAGRTERAVEQFKRAYSIRLAAGQLTEADQIRNELASLDPDADISTGGEASPSTHGGYHQQDQLPGFSDSAPSPLTPKTFSPPAPAAEPEAAADDDGLNIEQTGMEGGLDINDTDGSYGRIDLDSGFSGSDAVDLPPLDIAVEPGLGLDSDLEHRSEDGFMDLPSFDTGDSAEDDDSAMSLPTLDDFGDAAGELDSLPMLGEDDQGEMEALPGFDSEDAIDLPGFEGDVGDPGDYGSLAPEGAPKEGAETAGALPTFDFGPPGTEEVTEEADSGMFDLPSFDDAEPGTEPEDVEPAVDDFAFESPAIDDVEDEGVSEPAFAELVAEDPAVADEEAEEIEVEAASRYQTPPAAKPTFEHVEEEAPAAAEVAEQGEAPAPPFTERADEPWGSPPESPAAKQAEAAAAPPPAPPAAPVSPAKPKGDYVDLAAMFGEDELEDTTRFIVAEKPPTGDEEKDFADMLSQFKQKVAETIPKEDSGSHYDLGIAFKEMGLIDEAIGEFQTALRAGLEKLKVYEELGSCFVAKQQYSVAITVLNRAQQMPYTDEQELLGVYYNLGRAHEELGNRAEAKTAFEKIIAIDIGFQDTTERLGRL